MKRDVTPENFERFLKESADDLLLRPTDAVWRRIEGRMNRRRRRVFFTSAFFLLTTSLFGYLIIDHSKEVSDPFAGVATVAKPKTGSVENAAPKSSTAFGARLKKESATTKAVASNTNPLSVAEQTTTAQLFQNPISSTEDLLSAEGLTTSLFNPTAVDEWQPVSATNAVTTARKPQQSEGLPTIESVVNLYKPKSGKKKPQFQLFFTPTISYRRLTENKSYLRGVPQSSNSVSLAALYDVNNVVTHKPDMGLELGFAYKYPISKRIKLRGGMQFNINRYDIKAFTYVPERTTITLNTRLRGIDSVNTMSSYRNFSGGRADWLQNFYFQVSTPIGVEVSFSPAKKTRFGMATTIQPTYVLGDRAYLISTDYKNYSQVPWLIRRWNVNTSLETFVSYSSGKLRWQVGPQVRYQLLSSFVEKYPVKENLFDFGMKVGVSLNK
ncbi:MAG TPA: hypothetical protein VM010_01435 [Chitinophagaceae bacterium]|nr:hypothetical protein [Chitinophagaceae bacterium]